MESLQEKFERKWKSVAQQSDLQVMKHLQPYSHCKWHLSDTEGSVTIMTNQPYSLKKDRNVKDLIFFVGQNEKQNGLLFCLAVVFTLVALVINDVIDFSKYNSDGVLGIKLEICFMVVLVYFLLLMLMYY